MSDLRKKSCQACEGIEKQFSLKEIEKHLHMIDKNWQYDRQKNHISRSFHFKNHFEVMAFVNAVAWINHSEDHHPEMIVGYANCEVSYSTHAVNGITENDFICASKVDALLHAAD